MRIASPVMVIPYSIAGGVYRRICVTGDSTKCKP